MWRYSLVLFAAGILHEHALAQEGTPGSEPQEPAVIIDEAPVTVQAS